MRFRILMVTNKEGSQYADAEMLKERGFLVYNCTDTVVPGMISEVKPDVVFINPESPDLHITKVYHSILKDKELANIPVIYALNEDDLYLVSCQRNSRSKKNVTTDNVMDGIRMSLAPAIDKRAKEPLNLLGRQVDLWPANVHVA